MNKNSKIIIENKTNILILILNLLFMVYYIMLAYYSRPHYDDLHFLWKLNEMSIREYVGDMYFSRSGRFVSYFLNGVIFKTILYLNEYRFFPILFWLLGVGMCWNVAKDLFKSISSFLLLNVVLLFYNLFVLTNIDFAVFNWLCAMSYYLLAPILLITLKLLNKISLKWYQWFFLLLLSVVLGGGQETFTPIVLAALFLNGLYYFKANSYNIKNTCKDSRIRKICSAAFIMIICLLIVIIAPGNYARLNSSEFFSPTSLFGYIQGFTKAIGMFYYYIFFYIPYYFILVILFIQLGRNYSINDYRIKMSYGQLVFISSLIYFFYILLSVTPSVYLWSGFGIQRNYTHVVFFSMFFLCLQAFLFGNFKEKIVWQKYLNHSFNVALIIICLIMTLNFYNDSISARKYALSVDNRIEMLKQLNKKGITGIVSVDPINIPYTTDPKYLFYKLIGKKNNPQPVLYYISDTDTEPNEYAYYLQKVYDFNFLIKLKDRSKLQK